MFLKRTQKYFKLYCKTNSHEKRRIKQNKTSARFIHIVKHLRYILSLYFVILKLVGQDKQKLGI